MSDDLQLNPEPNPDEDVRPDDTPDAHADQSAPASPDDMPRMWDEIPLSGGLAADDDQPASDQDDADQPDDTAPIDEASPAGEEGGPEPVRVGSTQVPGPASAAPPRIVSEAPVGGTPQPAGEPEPEEHTAPDESAAPEEPAAEVVPAADESAPEPESEPEPAPTSEPEPDESDAPPTERIIDEQQWDDELSPELAAILFQAEPGPPAAADESAPEAPPAPAAPEPATPEAAPPPDTTPQAAPITLTDPAQARELPVTAGGVSSPPPGHSAPEGKVRYKRLEEPLRGDKGQRTVEAWEYFGPNWPALDGRLVKRIRVEEVAYADGSWSWEYERRYTDKGFDQRRVRANTDRTYIERRDSVKKPDAGGKQARHVEDARLILAGPPREGRGGLLGRLFGGLFGRGGAERDTGPKSWREATDHEARRARRRGGDAF